MNLHEYQSKQLLENFGLPTAKSVVAFFVKEVDMGQLKPGTHTIKYLNSHGDPSEVIFYVDPSQ